MEDPPATSKGRAATLIRSVVCRYLRRFAKKRAEADVNKLALQVRFGSVELARASNFATSDDPLVEKTATLPVWNEQSATDDILRVNPDGTPSAFTLIAEDPAMVVAAAYSSAFIRSVAGHSLLQKHLKGTTYIIATLLRFLRLFLYLLTSHGVCAIIPSFAHFMNNKPFTVAHDEVQAERTSTTTTNRRTGALPTNMSPHCLFFQAFDMDNFVADAQGLIDEGVILIGGGYNVTSSSWDFGPEILPLAPPSEVGVSELPMETVKVKKKKDHVHARVKSGLIIRGEVIETAAGGQITVRRSRCEGDDPSVNGQIHHCPTEDIICIVGAHVRALNWVRSFRNF